MRIFPYDKIILKSELSYKEALVKLKEKIEKTNILLSFSSSYAFAGFRNENTFKVIRTATHGSIKPVFKGKIEPDNEKCKLEIEISVRKSFKVMFSIMLTIILLVLLFGILKGNTTIILALSISLVAFLGFTKLIFMLGYDQDYYFGISEFKEIFKCK